MPALASELRNKLERAVIEARDVAEAGAKAALEALAVHNYEPYPHMKPELRELRNHLRARARQLGDLQDKSGRLALGHLVGECAYEHWHRMLFARFLAENNLLIEPDENIAISLSEAEELAKEEKVDVWTYASRCAQVMLPQIFRPEDPLLQVSLAIEHRIKLERILASLPVEVFTASDSLGWVYQFWQSKKKDEVNRSEVKIGADEISAVTQLFTEPYMVEFLFHNTLGAWWAGKKLSAKDAAGAKSEEELRRKLALPGVEWNYLRFVRGEDGKEGPWRPAAGTFEGWPKQAAELKVLDPCCGSGHFLVAAFHHLVPIRMEEEGLSARDAVDAVLRDNLYGLEIDERCCQIAAFALALVAWTYPKVGGYRLLPELHIACSGISPQASREQWIKLAEQTELTKNKNEQERVKNGFANLHELFSQAPIIGSFINPAMLEADLFAADYETITPYLSVLLAVENADDETRERAIAASGMVKAMSILTSKYTLVATNVPYLGRGKQDEVLKTHLSKYHSLGKADLATAFVLRCLDFPAKGGATALVTPQNWLFLATYKKLRQSILQKKSWNFLARLGPGAFQTIGGEVVNVALPIISAVSPPASHRMAGIEASDAREPEEKAKILRGEKVNNILLLNQKKQYENPDSRVTLEQLGGGSRLKELAIVSEGLHTGDYPRFGRCHWEKYNLGKDWSLQQGGTDDSEGSGGSSNILFWQEGDGELIQFVKERLENQALSMWIKGYEVWGKRGVAVGTMSELKHSIYHGALFTHGIVAIVPRDEENLAALMSYIESSEFRRNVRILDQKVCVARASFENVPFDLAHWEKVAAKKYPDGIPEPESDDPTQWLFHGHPYETDPDTMLQVAVARMLSYRWPAELDPGMRLSKRARGLVKQCEKLLKFADDDGIVCIPSVRGEDPASERLFAFLTACDIEPGVDLDDWLRNGFFEEHCKLFHDRPFIWHIWDGRKRDGFHALVNYHRLCEGKGKGKKLLESLTYSYLGEWITRQKDEVKRGEGGAEDRLAAALELQKRLELILEGEPPFDLFVRWKPLAEQPIGWEPDINDGVRMNIRPFLASDLPGGRTGAGILRYKPSIKWAKDRGKEPDRPKAEFPWFWGCNERDDDFMGGKTFDGNRWNDCHYSNQVKQAARAAAKKKGDR